MPAKITRSTPRRSFVLPKVTVADQTSLLSCRTAGKTRIYTPVWSHLGNPRSMGVLCRAGRSVRRAKEDRPI
jgi:hypothetical protein